MAVNNIIKRIQNIMRQDAGINGDAQRIEQMTWMFFLKVYDTQEDTWELQVYHSRIFTLAQLGGRRERRRSVDMRSTALFRQREIVSCLEKSSDRCQYTKSQKYCSGNIC